MDAGRLGAAEKIYIGLRGSYSGVLMAGLATSLVGLTLVNPLSLIVGVLVGRRAYREDKTIAAVPAAGGGQEPRAPAHRGRRVPGGQAAQGSTATRATGRARPLRRYRRPAAPVAVRFGAGRQSRLRRRMPPTATDGSRSCRRSSPASRRFAPRSRPRFSVLLPQRRRARRRDDARRAQRGRRPRRIRHASSTKATPPATAVLDGFRARLREPLRLAVAGMVKAGKSTVLNALIGEQIAPDRRRRVHSDRHLVPPRAGRLAITAHLSGGGEVRLPVKRSVGEPGAGSRRAHRRRSGVDRRRVALREPAVDGADRHARDRVALGAASRSDLDALPHPGERTIRGGCHPVSAAAHPCIGRAIPRGLSRHGGGDRAGGQRGRAAVSRGRDRVGTHRLAALGGADRRPLSPRRRTAFPRPGVHPRGGPPRRRAHARCARSSSAPSGSSPSSTAVCAIGCSSRSIASSRPPRSPR